MFLLIQNQDPQTHMKQSATNLSKKIIIFHDSP